MILEADITMALLSLCLGLIIIITDTRKYWPWISAFGIFSLVTIIFWWYSFPMFIYWTLFRVFGICFVGIWSASMLNIHRIPLNLRLLYLQENLRRVKGK